MGPAGRDGTGFRPQQYPSVVKDGHLGAVHASVIRCPASWQPTLT
jgi:hypothetical protein